MTDQPWWKILADNWRGRSGNTTTGDSVRNSCADELERVAARHTPAVCGSPTDRDAAHAQHPTAYELSEEDYRRARDCMIDILRNNGWTITKDRDEKQFDNAFQHAVGIMSLTAIRTPAVCGSPTDRDAAHAQGAVEYGVDEMLRPLRKIIGESPLLTSILYDADLMPEQIRTRGRALHLVALCAVFVKWQEAEEKLREMKK